jgi:lipopolysaccharide assembly outer membrane protein LptD (OstA)
VIVLTWILGVGLFVPGAAIAEFPDEAQLSADRMRFDSQSGDFVAAGNVVIKVGELTVCAPRGVGNIKDKEVHFEEGIVASGDWQGEWIDLAAGSISLFYGQTPTYIAEDGVKGDYGKISIDADKFYVKGPDISALTVRRLENHEMNVAFGAGSVQGTVLDGVLTTWTATRNVWLQGRPNAGEEMVDIRGDKAVYSVERGSVVLSGNVSAVQKGRALTAQSLVYFPNNNRIDAIGGIDVKGKEAVTIPAKITIDLSQEKRK